MSLRLFLLERRVPSSIRRRTFRDLVRLCAEAFGVPAPDIHRMPHGEAVAQFARFTREQAERALRDEPAGAAVRERMYEGAREMGSTLRRRLGLRTSAQSIRALRVLYGAIGIDLEGDCRSGEIVINRCAFSRAYTPEVCAFISALDAGIAAGLTGGSALVFTERITAGAPRCRAHLTERPVQ